VPVAKLKSAKFVFESLKGKGHSEDISIGGRTILKLHLTEIEWEDVDWINVA
jgi:hypothetical protein